MGVATIGRRPRFAPPPHARVDWSHPLAQGLLSCVIFPGGKPVDLAYPFLAVSTTGSPTGGTGQFGDGLRCDNGAAEVGVSCTQGALQRAPLNANSITVAATPTGTTPSNAPIFALVTTNGTTLVNAVALTSGTNLFRGIVTDNSGASTVATSAVGFTAGVATSVRESATAASLWFGGNRIATSAPAGAMSSSFTSSADIRVGRQLASTRNPAATFNVAMFHGRVLSASEIALLHADPFQFLVW